MEITAVSKERNSTMVRTHTRARAPTIPREPSIVEPESEPGFQRILDDWSWSQSQKRLDMGLEPKKL